MDLHGTRLERSARRRREPSRRTARGTAVSLSVRRGVIVAGVVAVLVAVGLVDANVGRPPRAAAAPSVVPAAGVSAVLPPGSGSGAWFCAGGSGPQAGAEVSVVVTNPTPATVTGTMVAVPSKGASKRVAIDVAPGGITSVTPAQVAGGPWVAAEVLLDQPGAGVTETVATPLGWSTTPCASTTATSWYFTGLSTAGQDGVALSILNPTVTPAVVDTTLTTSVGQKLQPAAYQGVTVAPGALVTEYLSDHDEGDPNLSATVTAVSGTVVAAALQSFTAHGAQGVAIDLGAAGTATRWAFPSSEEIPGGSVSYVVFDPGRRAARVQMAVQFDQGSASPIAVSVPAGQAVVVQASSEARVPVGSPFAATFTSTTGVVVARDVRAPGSGGTPEQGLSLGVPVPSRTWLVPPITSPGQEPWSFAVQDLGTRAVSVSVSAVTGTGSTVPVAGLQHVSVTAARPFVISGSVPAPVGSLPLLVSASGPVAVELDPEPVGSPGVVVLPTEPVG